ncbi:hypothetical protein EV652_13117 [Kribbella steppae]|uniref:Uncharacterized protein n=1 Tax=Kribbella steppae TaxID=2512223 RepID=A0A4R2GR91_9ACTN|nr:hypothetical protein EV652_13117 [Kribbella steppae]
MPPVRRIMFTANALPVIGPVNHAVVGDVIVACYEDTAVLSAVGLVVVDEVDEIVDTTVTASGSRPSGPDSAQPSDRAASIA